MPRTNPSSATASPAVSSFPEPTAPGGLCAIHQPNLLPRLTTLAKLFAADYWIVLDDVQFARRDYQHRARIAALDDVDRYRWLTVPTHLPHGRRTLIRDALIADRAASRRRTSSILRQDYGASTHWPTLDRALLPVWEAFSTGRTAAVAAASTRALLDTLGWRGQILASSALTARRGRSERLADLAAATGAHGYLCGTGGMTYLDHAPFADQGVAVFPFLPPASGIWASGRRISALWAIATRGPDAVAARLRTLALAHGALRSAAWSAGAQGSGTEQARGE
ncbi:WbqC family protein [Streptomyces sp. NPDC004732]|uniref:WbqC family protein n=1 Tax=Streptomyces sp. NPDC004732 TaxID=3154290 RepID=UPI0033B35D6D